MNATPTHLLPGNPVQSSAPGGRAADAGTPDTPFSQVLSNEMAQAPAKGAHGNTADAETATETAASATGNASPDAAATDALQGLAGLLIPGMTAADGQPALPLPTTDPAEAALTGDANPGAAVADAAATVLALAITPASSQAVPAASASPDGEAPAGDARGTGSALAAHGHPGALRLQQADSAEHAPSGAQAAARFSEQLAATRQADAAKTGEQLTDLMGNPALRPVPNAPLDALPLAEPAAAARLAPAVGTPAWGQALGEKIVWMAHGAQQSASLTLNPPNLGPLQVVLEVNNDQANASFFAAQPEVRQALEAALPRLRELMHEAGIQLGQATVSADTPRQQDGNERQMPRANPAFAGAHEADPSSLPAPATIVRAGRGLVDTFA